MAGATIGANFQTDAFVFGAEADFDGSWIDGKVYIPGGVTAATQVVNDNRTGFTVGAGIEFGLVENLSGKIEYDFYDFGSKTYSFNAITPVSVKSYLHTLTVGLNYRFNWSGGPKP